MALTGLIPIIVVVVVVIPSIFFMVKVFKNLDSGQKGVAKLMQTGAVAQGRLAAVQMGGMSVTTGAHRHVQLQMMVDIYPQAQGQYRAQSQPQRVQITQIVSELQIAQLQPGAHVEVRYDPQNPQRAIVSGIAGYGGMQPLHTMQMPAAAKMGLIIGVASAVVAVIVVVVVGFGSMSFGSSYDDDSFSSSADEDEDEKKKDDEDEDDKKKDDEDEDASDVCAQATKCCKAVFSGNAGNCDQWEKNDFEPACKAALEGYQKSLKARGKSCD